LGAEKGHTKIVQILLNSGASIDSVDIAGRTALHCAVESRKLEVVRVLLERGADAKRKDANGMSVLHLAVDKGYEDIVLLLIENKIKFILSTPESLYKYNPVSVADHRPDT
jgi:ankyrin repeat protein